MRAVPWLTSLMLHCLFLFGIILLSRTPPLLPKQLTIDFQLTPKLIAEVVEIVDTAPIDALPPPVKEITPPVEKKPAQVKPVPPPPIAEISEPLPPLPDIQEEEIVKMIEPVPAQEVVEEISQPVPVVVESFTPPIESEPQTTAPIVDRRAEIEAAEIRYTQTVTQVRGQILNKLGYPAVARRKGWCGKMVLGFILCDDGSVENLEVVESSGHRMLDRAALQAVAASTPFRGVYPRTEVRLPINFQLE